MQYDIYIDESGLFAQPCEEANQAKAVGQRHKNFDSQLAGIISSASQLTREKARDLVVRACTKSDVILEHSFHSTEIKRQNRTGFDRLIVAIGERLKSSDVQPFRMVNRENVSFGDRKTTYTNILAELLVRICRKLSQRDAGEIALNVYTARVRTNEDASGIFEVWTREDYLPRIREVFMRVAIANGWSNSASKWRIDNLELLSAKEDERLWVCDAISNASHADFTTIGFDAASALRNSLAEFDWSLSFNETLDQVITLEDRDAFGLALIALAERSLAPWTSQEARKSYAEAAVRIGPKLFALPVEIQLPQLSMILGWLQQVSERRSDLSFAQDACRWIESYAIQKNSHLIDNVILSWFTLCISTWALTACNHSGNTNEGKKHADRISKLMPELAGCWEHAPDLMHALITQAVYFNDCFDHERVVNNMSLVSHYYQSLGGFFHEAFPTMFPKEIRSDLCGKALGTQLQSEISLILAGRGDIEKAREISDAAIEQFSHKDDRQRQYQYRCELEAVAGEWSLARSYLRRSLGMDEDSHDELAAHIASLVGISQGFALLHWTRIGGLAAIERDSAEVESFFTAFRSHKLNHSQWVVGDIQNYPVHGILRRVAAVYAFVGEHDKAREAIARLDRIVAAAPRLVFQMINTAAKLQMAGLIGDRDRRLMDRILEGGKSGKSLLSQIQDLNQHLDPNLASHSKILTGWISCLEDNVAHRIKPVELVVAGRVIGY